MPVWRLLLETKGRWIIFWGSKRINQKNRQSRLISGFAVKVRQKRKAHPRLFPGVIPGAVSGLTYGHKQAASPSNIYGGTL